MNEACLSPLGRDQGITLWRQIMRTLEQQITGGDYPPGAKLPTEAELSARFNVNRHTVRRALEELSRGGLVRVEQGRGTFAAEDVLDYTVGTRTRFSEIVRRHNREPSGRILSMREVAADAAASTALGLRKHARVILVERLGMADGRPVTLSDHFFPAARFPSLIEALGPDTTISEALASCGVVDYRRQTTRVTARLPTPAETELLRTSRNRPLLVTEAINVDELGAVIEYGVTRYPTPRVQIVFET